MFDEVMNRLAEASRRNTTLAPRQFETSTNSQGSLSDIATLMVDTALALRTGRRNPLRLAIPAYQSFETAGDGSDQTFSVTHDLTACPDTQDVVVWFDGEYQGSPQSVNHDTDEFTISGPGAVQTVHAYYISEKAASFELRKKTPSAKTTNSEKLYEVNLGLLHEANQSEQPEYLSLGESELQRFLASDMELTARLKAPYQVRWTDPDGDDTEPTNALLQVPAQKSNGEIEGLTSAISADMGR
ncbi:hypothetical protein [Halorubrum sp. GN11GM_10-3_MGM]|uniref:hypothetical protein n=1 Tax=Halorubrum sp. GN11GM_10-3_MGM TaxID=2518111 RepID=UPI0010F63545|nr:hypothetical protein [Halorubrum sp. GN11GM_10-3_MGM]TKX70949.1 hypothetical protein EXE40_08615 [Halorubrum sp. GN11GM_10-3_MGM]